MIGMKTRQSQTVTLLVAALLLFFVTASSTSAQSFTPVDDDIFQLFCPAIAQPIPTGVTDRPPTDFGVPHPDYNYLHSSTHLQGAPTKVKYAPGLFFTPPGTFNGFRSAVIVNNPSPTVTVIATIQYYDTAGTLLPATTVTLQPEQSYSEGATALLAAASTSPGLGSAVISADQPIVGGTIHHTYEIGSFCDPDPFTPGAASLQQLQQIQRQKKTLWWGPLPASNQASFDFLNGILPLFWVQNPNPAVNNITITFGWSTGSASFAATLQPNGTLLDLTLFNALATVYGGGAPFDENYTVTVTSDDDLPLIGEGIMTDFFGPGMTAGTRFRMGSTMMANSRPKVLVNPELTYEVSGPSVTSLMGIWNSSNQNIGPVTVRYYNRDGVVLGTDTFSNFAAGRTLRIGPGLGTPNYPAPGVFDGWVRISACKNGLVGWTMREVEGGVFNKVYGETLHGTNNKEPGNGVAVTVGGSNLIRKVMPISQVWDASWFWPGVSNFVSQAANVGDYFWRFHDFFGGADITNYSAQPFAGVRWGHTSFTYQDPEASPFVVPQLVSGRADHTSGTIKGITVLGDPLVEFFLPNFLPFPTCSP